jgi:hypothetical protein
MADLSGFIFCRISGDNTIKYDATRVPAHPFCVLAAWKEIRNNIARWLYHSDSHHTHYPVAWDTSDMGFLPS